MNDYTTRPAEVADAEAIRSIYNVEVLESTVTFDMVERSLTDQIDWIADHSGSYPAIVALDQHNQVVGFASLTAYRPRPAYATTVENSVYVDRQHRGKGLGVLLMEQLLVAAADHGFHSVIARTVGDHTASIALHKRVGFTEIGREVEVGRKFGKWLDVVVLQRMI